MTEEGIDKLLEPDVQKICCGIVSPINDRNTSFIILQQYGCLRKT